MTDKIRNTVILGSGSAGLTAAIYAARANLKPLVLDGHEPGGQLSITTLVENFPGWPEGIQGPELIEKIRRQASRFGTEFRMGHVVAVDLSKRPFELNLGSETIHTLHSSLPAGHQRAGSDSNPNKSLSDTALARVLPVMDFSFRARRWLLSEEETRQTAGQLLIRSLLAAERQTHFRHTGWWS